MESPTGSTKSSQEAEIGLRVEDLWDVQEPLLSPSEKLNSCFDGIPVSAFPAGSHSSQGCISRASTASNPISSLSFVVEIPSNSSLASAVETLSKHKILSAPVYNVDASEDASWIERYVGIVEFAGIAVWLLHQSEVASPRSTPSSPVVNSNGAFEVSVNSSHVTPAFLDSTASPGRSDPESIPSVGGSFFKNLTSSELYKNTKVQDISGSFRWAPFLPLQSSDSFLTMLLLLSKYRMKSLPVVDVGEGKIDKIVTQSAAVHVLAECVGLDWFEKWGTKKLSELELPIMKPGHIIKIGAEEPVLKAFKLMRMKGVGGIPVVDGSGKKVVGNISIRDIQFLLIAPELFKGHSSVSVKHFLSAVGNYLTEHEEASPLLAHVMTCRRDDTIKDVILQLDFHKIHRIYVVDKEDKLEGVITIRDIISKLVHEPRGYFGDFFDGVVPLPKNSRV